MKVLIWNINTFGGRDEHKYNSPDRQKYLKFEKQMEIENRIFQYLSAENPDICGLVEFDCQARSAAKDLIIAMEKED